MEEPCLQICQQLNLLYCGLLADVKCGAPIFEDIIGKGSKLFSAVKTISVASNDFLNSIQRLADLASKTVGGSKEIGAHFTRLCMRQKRVESKFQIIGDQLISCFVDPLISHLDKWKKTLAQIEKEHNRESKRCRSDLKRALSETNRLKRKLAKQGNSSSMCSPQTNSIGSGVGLGEPPTRRFPCSVSTGIGRSSLAVRTESALTNLKEKMCCLEDLERSTIKRLMLEERGRYCLFFNCLRPVLETQTSMLSEVSSLQELLTALTAATENPSQLLADAEEVLAHTDHPPGDLQSTALCGSLLCSPAAKEVDIFTSVVDALSSGKQLGQLEATSNLPSKSLGSTSTNRSEGNASAKSAYDGHGESHCSSHASVTSWGTNSLASTESNEASAIRQGIPTSKDTAVQLERMPHSPATNGYHQPIVNSDSIVEKFRHFPLSYPSPPNEVTATDSSVRRIPATVALPGSVANPRYSTCTLQVNELSVFHRDDLEEGEEESASRTEEEETSEEGLNGYSKNEKGVFSKELSGNDCRPPNLAVDGHTMLYPDQFLPPPVYTNLNKLSHTAQRIFSMSSMVPPHHQRPLEETRSPPENEEEDNLSISSAPHRQAEPMTMKGVYSVPGSPNRPSLLSPSCSFYRPAWVEDPFSADMDELDQIVAGSSATSSMTSRSIPSGINPPRSLSQHSSENLLPNLSTGVPTGLVQTGTSPDSRRRSRMWNASVCDSIEKTHEVDDPEHTKHKIDLCPLLSATNTSSRQQRSTRPAHQSTSIGTTASLLTELSGQLQQLTTSNLQSSLTGIRSQSDCDEFNFPALSFAKM